MLLVFLAVFALGQCTCDIKGGEVQDTWDYVKVRHAAHIHNTPRQIFILFTEDSDLFL